MQLKNDTVFVICEYNPFHYGHLYQITELKRRFSRVVCVMSGNFVQRGEIAIAEKYIRAKAAVFNGADLVFELPFPYSCMSAEDFATAGVFLADALCAKTLAFGAESDLAMLKNAAEVIYDKTKIKNYIKTQKNLSFPRAIEAILSQEMGTEYAEAMKKPNNILGVEYICAIQRLESKIVPIAIKRQSEFASASQIRELFLKNTGDFSCIPQKAAEVYKELENDEFPRSIYNMSDVFLYALRTKSKKSLYGIDSGTAKKLHLIARQVKSLYELIYSPLFTEITNARLRRAIISSVFEITADDAKTKPLYALLLAANQNGCAYLKENQNQFKIPVITKPAHMKYYNNGEEKEIFAAFLRAEVADTVAALSAPSKKNAVSGMTFSPYILQ